MPARWQVASGVGTKDVALLDMAVNPDSGRLYVVARRQDTKAYFFVTVSPTGEIAQFDLEDVHYAQVPLPKGDSTPVGPVTDLGLGPVIDWWRPRGAQ